MIADSGETRLCKMTMSDVPAVTKNNSCRRAVQCESALAGEKCGLVCPTIDLRRGPSNVCPSGRGVPLLINGRQRPGATCCQSYRRHGQVLLAVSHTAGTAQCYLPLALRARVRGIWLFRFGQAMVTVDLIKCHLPPTDGNIQVLLVVCRGGSREDPGLYHVLHGKTGNCRSRGATYVVRVVVVLVQTVCTFIPVVSRTHCMVSAM